MKSHSPDRGQPHPGGDRARARELATIAGHAYADAGERYSDTRTEIDAWVRKHL